MALARQIIEAKGLYTYQVRPWTGALSVAFAGSFHWGLTLSAEFEFFADQDAVVYVTDAAHDPLPPPVIPEQLYPGAVIRAGNLYRFQFVFGDSVAVDPGPVVYVADGVRFVSLSGLPGTFWVNEYARRVY